MTIAPRLTSSDTMKPRMRLVGQDKTSRSERGGRIRTSPYGINHGAWAIILDGGIRSFQEGVFERMILMIY